MTLSFETDVTEPVTFNGRSQAALPTGDTGGGDRLDLLMDRLEQMEYAFVEVNEGNQALTRLLIRALDQRVASEGPEVLAQLSAIQAQLDSASQSSVVASDVAGLRDEMARLVDVLCETDLNDGVPVIDQETLTDELASIRTALDAVTAAVSTSPSGDTQIDQDEVQRRLESLENKIDALRTRPDPVLDLAPQRRTFAQFATVLGQILSKFEGLAQDMASRLPDADAATSDDHIADKLDALSAGIDDLVRRIDANATSPGVPDDMQRLINDLSERVSEIPKGGSFVAVRAQQESFARFQTANQATIGRLQSVVDGLAERLDTLDGRLTSITPTPDADYALLDDLRQSLANLTAKVDALPKVATAQPAVALQAHQQSLIRLQTANKATLDRFEALATTIVDQINRFDERLTALRADATRVEAESPIAAARGDGDAVLDAHRTFLSDLRVAVAESLAVSLRQGEPAARA